MNNDTLAVIQQQSGKHSTHVFTYKGNPVTRTNNHAWKKVLIRADIADLTMVLRYAYLSSKHLEGYAGNSKL
ncbi:MAG: hypothetical protein ABL913_13285 [Methyloglobulus sp.]